MEESFQIGHTVGNRIGRRRNKSCRSGPSAADPVLRAPELARRLVAAPAARQQLGVHLPDEAVAERKAFAHPAQPVLQRHHVVRTLPRHRREGRRAVRPSRTAGDQTAMTGCPRLGRTAGPLCERSGRGTGECQAAASRGHPRGPAPATPSPAGLAGPDRSRAGSGGRRAGTNARMVSPPTVVVSYRPVSPRCMRRRPC